MEPGAHPTRHSGRQRARHQPQKAKRSTDSVGGPSCKIEVKGIVDAGFTYYGSVRYYAPEISVFDKKTAGVTYCADESKAFNKNRKTNKVTKSPATDNSYVLYSTRVEKDNKGVWQTTKLESERGNKKCTP